MSRRLSVAFVVAAAVGVAAYVWVAHSLDGFVADADGNFEWAAPDVAVHAFVNDLERPIGTYLYGRRMYEVMQYQAPPTAASDAARDAPRVHSVVLNQ